MSEGTVKLTDLRTYSAPWTLHKLLILRSSADRFRLQNPRILLNLTVPRFVNSLTEPLLQPIRRVLPTMGRMDFSPIVLLVGLQMLKGFL